MPYIDPERRKELLERFPLDPDPKSVGELNFLITRLCVNWVQAKGLNYQSINDVTGVLDAVSKEFYLRVAIPYETKKIMENGDVYAEIVPPIPGTK